MFKLDNNFLVTMGLGGLPVDEKNRLLQMIYERLEMNVGMRLAEKMTDAQLDEFESFIDRNDEAAALKWLESNFPNYKDVVAEELEKLKVEVQAAAPQILSVAQSAPSAATGAFSQAPTPGMPPIAQEPVMPPAAAYQPTPQTMPDTTQPTAAYNAPTMPSTPAASPYPIQPPANVSGQPAVQQPPIQGSGSAQPQPWQPAQQPPYSPTQPVTQPWSSPQPATTQTAPQDTQTPPQQGQGFTPPPAGFGNIGQ